MLDSSRMWPTNPHPRSCNHQKQLKATRFGQDTVSPVRRRPSTTVVAVGIVGDVSAVGSCGSAVPSAEFPVALPCPPPTLLNLETSSSGAAGGSQSQDGFLSYCRLRYAMPMPLFSGSLRRRSRVCRPCQILECCWVFELGEMRSGRRLDAWLSPPKTRGRSLLLFPFSLVSLCRSLSLSLRSMISSDLCA